MHEFGSQNSECLATDWWKCERGSERGHGHEEEELIGELFSWRVGCSPGATWGDGTEDVGRRVADKIHDAHQLNLNFRYKWLFHIKASQISHGTYLYYKHYVLFIAYLWFAIFAQSGSPTKGTEAGGKDPNLTIQWARPVPLEYKLSTNISMNEILTFASSHPKVPLNSKEILNERKRIEPRPLDLLGRQTEQVPRDPGKTDGHRWSTESNYSTGTRQDFR